MFARCWSLLVLVLSLVHAPLIAAQLVNTTGFDSGFPKCSNARFTWEEADGTPSPSYHLKLFRNDNRTILYEDLGLTAAGQEEFTWIARAPEGLVLRLWFGVLPDTTAWSSYPFIVTRGNDSCMQLYTSTSTPPGTTTPVVAAGVTTRFETWTFTSTTGYASEATTAVAEYDSQPGNLKILMGALVGTSALSIASISVIIFLLCRQSMSKKRTSNDPRAPVPFLRPNAMQQANAEGIFPTLPHLSQKKHPLPSSFSPQNSPVTPTLPPATRTTRGRAPSAATSIIFVTPTPLSPATTITPTTFATTAGSSEDPFRDEASITSTARPPTYVGRSHSPAPTYNSYAGSRRRMRVVNADDALIREIAARTLTEEDVEAIAQRVAEISMSKGIK